METSEYAIVNVGKIRWALDNYDDELTSGMTDGKPLTIGRKLMLEGRGYALRFVLDLCVVEEL